MSVPLTDMQKRKSDSNPFPRPRFYSYPTPPDREAIEKIKRPQIPIADVLSSRPSSVLYTATVAAARVAGSPDVKVLGFSPK